MTNERLCIFLVFSNLIASKLLSSNRRMHNFIAKFTKIYIIWMMQSGIITTVLCLEIRGI